jgi:hypothetical protein
MHCGSFLMHFAIAGVEVIEKNGNSKGIGIAAPASK